ncbi:flavin reductase family protein [Lentibacter algarum]|uniref:flavin reductase family protein n=1 Tax=Lentibacter algarum TaxID=576131 RepID=UPI001C0698D8|nr:flavin reductase family protein [Lentibacter algarum]MBU2980926.1 flavin reductase family protein [Lentibacter algarum]
MFYRPQDGHGLPHNPFNALIVPRPIAWISTRNSEGIDNLAPYSFFSGTAYEPPQVMFASTGTKPDRDNTKDTVGNIRASQEFCVNLVDEASTDAMNTSSRGLPADASEFDHAKLTRANCETIACARVASAPASLECKLVHIQQSKGAANYVVIGEVTGIHLRDDCIVDGKFDSTRFIPLARMGYRDYALVREVFELARPDD